MRAAGFLLSVVVVLWAAVAVPMPYRQTVPGSARPVEDIVTIAVDEGPVNGDLSLLTVRSSDATPIDVLVAAIRPGEQLEPLRETLPPGIDQQTLREIQAQQFANSFTTAVGVAAEYAGYEITVRTEAVVAQVVPAGPSDGALRPGDVIVAFEGAEVTSGGELVDLLGSIDEARTVELDVHRDADGDGAITVEVQLEQLVSTGRPGLGIIVETVTAPIELPFDVQLAEANIIGPSAGLMIAVTATDLLLEEDLARGRVIAGTGEIDGTGRVGPIGSVELKVETAIEAGADLVLVPLSQAADAAAAADGRIEVVGVATLADAIDALRGEGLASP